MAKRPTTPRELREAVERTVQATVGSAERGRDRAQGDLSNLREAVDDIVRSAESSIARSRKAVAGARPATHEDIRDLRAELRKIGRRLDAIEERLPAKRSGGTRKAAAKRK